MLLHPAWAWWQQQLLAASVQQELQSRKCQELSHEAGNLPQVLLPARGRPHQPHSSAGGGLGIRVRKSQGLASWFHCRAGNYLECFFVCYFLPFFFFSPHEHLLDIKPCVKFSHWQQNRQIFTLATCLPGQTRPMSLTHIITTVEAQPSHCPSSSCCLKLCVSSLGYPVLAHLRAQGM